MERLQHLSASVVPTFHFLGQGNPNLKTMLCREKWHRWWKPHKEILSGLLPTPKAGLASGMRCQILGASYTWQQVVVVLGSHKLCFRADLSFQSLIPQEQPQAGANSSGAEEEQSRMCCCHSRGRGSMETPERASLQAVSKQQDHRHYQGTYKARCEARIISIHLAKCFQSSFQSRLKENRVSIEQTKLICTYSTLFKIKLKQSDCCLLLDFYFPLQQNTFYFFFF